MLPLNVQEVAHRLVELGLSEGEAKAYVQLTRLGRCKASELSKTLDVGRTDTYHILHRLVERGFATATLEKPARFEAHTPERVFARLHDDSRARLDVVERARVEIEPILVTLRAAPDATMTPSSTLDIVHGRVDVHTAMRGLIDRAERRIDIICLVAGANAAIVSLEDHLPRAIQKGVAVRAVFADAPPLQAWAREHPEVHARFLSSTRLVQLILRDDAEDLIVIERDARASLTASGDVALVTGATQHVAAHLLLFDELWARAREAAPLA